MPGFLLVAAVLAILALAIVLGAKANSARRSALVQLASQLGLSFTALDATGRYLDRTFDLFQRGTSRSASHILAGQWQGLPVAIFDYHYRTGSGRYSHLHAWTVVVTGLSARTSYVGIQPRAVFALLAERGGAPEVPLAPGVAPGFQIKSPDAAFAHRVVDGPLAEFLTRNAVGISIEMFEQRLLLRVQPVAPSGEWLKLLQLAKFVHDRVAHAAGSA